jgi:hypothetical protein
MGILEKHGERWVYKQDDGETTAVFLRNEHKTELAHSGTAAHAKAFLALVALGAAYLAFVFTFF